MIRETIKEAMKFRSVKQIELAEYIGVTKDTMPAFVATQQQDYLWGPEILLLKLLQERKFSQFITSCILYLPKSH